MTTANIPHLLGYCDAIVNESTPWQRNPFVQAGVDADAHAIMRPGDAIRDAIAEGRAVASFRVRSGDPECYLVRR